MNPVLHEIAQTKQVKSRVHTQVRLNTAICWMHMPKTTANVFRKLLEIQSKLKLKQDAHMEGQTIYKRRLINGKAADVTSVIEI